jgi:hypothetical protein
MARNVIHLGVSLISLIVGCAKNQSQKNVCQIDGQPPQWVGQKNGKSCEFFHYSDIERHPHSAGPIANKAGLGSRTRCPTVRLKTNPSELR